MRTSRDLLLDAERKMLVESICRFRDEVIEESRREIDEFPDSGKVEELWKKSASLGLTSALLGEESGGQEMDVYSFCLALTELAAGSGGFAAMVLSHNLALWAAQQAGIRADETSLIGGESWAALAYPFDGEKAQFVIGGFGAAAVVFENGGRLYRADPGGEGVLMERIELPMGLRPSRPAVLRLDGLSRLPGEEFPSEAGAGLEALLLLGLASISLGLTRRAYQKALAYARERYQGGDYIIEHQQMRLMLADMMVGLEAVESLLRQTAEADGGPRLTPCRAVKIAACDAAVEAATDGVQIHGGYGYMRDYGMEMLMRDAKYCQAFPRPQQEERLDILEGQ